MLVNDNHAISMKSSEKDFNGLDIGNMTYAKQGILDSVHSE
ncbi:MAG: hypothetical protein ACM31E_00900 [Fibrobacterota bacterium]